MYDEYPDLDNKVLTPKSDIQNIFAVEQVGTIPRHIMPVSNELELGLSMELEKVFQGKWLKRSPKDAYNTD